MLCTAHPCLARVSTNDALGVDFMSRGFDGFEIDDFRGSDFDPDRDVSRNPSSDWNRWTELHNIHREEERADRVDRKAPDRSDKDRPPLPPQQRAQTTLPHHSR